MSWAQTQECAQMLDLELPKVIYQGVWDEAKIKAIANNIHPEICEGFVVRKVEKFHYNDFERNIAKWVRPHYVQTHEHWMYREVIPNQLSMDK